MNKLARTLYARLSVSCRSMGFGEQHGHGIVLEPLGRFDVVSDGPVLMDSNEAPARCALVARLRRRL